MSDIFKVKSNNQWIGLNAMVGPQGPQGPAGQDGADGTPAGFGIPTASASSLQPGTSPTVSVTASGPDTAKVFNFSFGIPNSGVVQADWTQSDTTATDYIKHKPSFISVTIPYSAWVNDTYVATVSGMTTTANILCGGEASTMEEIIKCGVYCSAQGVGTLTFKCISTPESNVTFGVYIL